MSIDTTDKLSRGALIALVVGSMIGSGIFSLPQAFAANAGVIAAFIAWVITGSGMLMLAFVFQGLSRRRPDLDSGIYAYARDGFGSFTGFAAAFGYWAGCCLADVACLILIKSTLGQFFPIFGDGTTVPALIGASAILWGFHFLILRGVKEAAAINTIVTIAKILPLGLFIVFMVAGFQADIFQLNFIGFAPYTNWGLFDQVRNTLLVTVFVFVGIEGASVYSRYAKDRDDVGVATVLGFLGVLALLFMVTMLSFGVMLRQDLAALGQPSMAGLLAHVVGPWGAIFISVGLLVSVLGNYLSWSLLAAEVLFSAANDKVMPKTMAGVNENQVPSAALWATNILIQFFLLVSPFADYAFKLALKMTAAMTLVPYLLVAAYALKITVWGASYEGDPSGRVRDRWVAVVAVVYTLGMIVAGGVGFLLLSALIYAGGTVLYFQARKDHAEGPMNTAERVVCGLVFVAAAVALAALSMGRMTL